jgi:hypothetical protein
VTEPRRRRRGALDVRGERSWRPSTSRTTTGSSSLCPPAHPPLQHLRPWPGRRGRDPRLRAARAQERGDPDPQRGRSDPQRGATSTTSSTASSAPSSWTAIGQSFNIGNARSTVTIYQLAPARRAARELAHPTSTFVPRGTSPTSSCASPEDSVRAGGALPGGSRLSARHHRRRSRVRGTPPCRSLAARGAQRGTLPCRRAPRVVDRTALRGAMSPRAHRRGTRCVHRPRATTLTPSPRGAEDPPSA